MPAPTYPLYLTAAGQPAFTAETAQGGFMPEYPFGEARRDALVITQRFWQLRANYSRPSANTQNCSAYASAYFIQDSGFRDVGMGIVEWIRTWATIPAQWSEPEEFAYQFPAYTVGVSFGTAYAVTAIAASSANYVLTTTATGISVGDEVYVDVEYTRSSLAYRSTFCTRAVAVSSGVSVTIPGLLVGSGTFSSVSGNVRKGNRGRSLPETLATPSRLIHDYALTSDAAIDTDLPILNRFTPVDSSGYEVQYLTGSTMPTTSAYSDMIKNGVELVAEPSIRRRYLGNIFVRITRVVKAA